MWSNGNDCGCLWIILIIILLCCCCGGGNNACCSNNCGCQRAGRGSYANNCSNECCC